MTARYNAKQDLNHAAIRAYYRDSGLIVADTFRLGGGAPDLFVSTATGIDWRETESGGMLRAGGTGLLVEIKSGNKSGQQLINALTSAEAEFLASWNGPYAIVSTPQQANEVWLAYIMPE